MLVIDTCIAAMNVPTYALHNSNDVKLPLLLFIHDYNDYSMHANSEYNCALY